jgi:hypothetical protein
MPVSSISALQYMMPPTQRRHMRGPGGHLETGETILGERRGGRQV